MSLRAKLISTVSAFVLVLALMTMGIYAVLTQNVKLGGSISFQAQDVQAIISKGVVAGGTLADANSKLQAITLDAEHDGSEQIATWSNLDLSFAESGEDVTITFDITNNHPEKALLVAMTTNSGTADNATMTVTSTSGEIENIEIEAKGEGEAQKATYVVTFHIIDKNDDASITGFNIKIDLSLVESYTATIHFVDYQGGVPATSWGWETNDGRVGPQATPTESDYTGGLQNPILNSFTEEITGVRTLRIWYNSWAYFTIETSSGKTIYLGADTEQTEYTFTLDEDMQFNITLGNAGGEHSGGTN